MIRGISGGEKKRVTTGMINSLRILNMPINLLTGISSTPNIPSC